ncbi:hypothetical protein ACC691_38515, partial [Rhizobium johnstonii]|uniref:hypothetical protein n=1 Tax=Rhizobium johnstonii TaxID=3019933 RepID=UPI003F9A9FD3
RDTTRVVPAVYFEWTEGNPVKNMLRYLITGVAEINAMLREAHALPHLAKHDALDWHLHATEPEAQLAERIRVEAALALVDVIRSGQMGRLRVC